MSSCYYITTFCQKLKVSFLENIYAGIDFQFLFKIMHHDFFCIYFLSIVLIFQKNPL